MHRTHIHRRPFFDDNSRKQSSLCSTNSIGSTSTDGSFSFSPQTSQSSQGSTSLHKSINELITTILHQHNHHTKAIQKELHLKKDAMLAEYPVLKEKYPSPDQFAMKIDQSAHPAIKFMLMFVHMTESYFHHLQQVHHFPLAHTALPYIRSLNILLNQFSLTSYEILSNPSKSSSQLHFIEDKKLFPLFHSHITYLRLLSYDYSEFCSEITNLHLIERYQINIPQFPFPSDESFLNSLEMSSIVATEAWKVSKTIETICQTFTTMKSIEKIQESLITKEEHKNVISSIKNNQFKVIKKGNLLVKCYGFSGVSYVAAKVILFDGGLLFFVNKNGEVEFGNWFSNTSMKITSVKNHFTSQPNSGEAYEFSVSSLETKSNENTAHFVSIDKNVLSNWHDSISAIIIKKDTAIIPRMTTRPQKSKVRKLSFQSNRDTLPTDQPLSPRSSAQRSEGTVPDKNVLGVMLDLLHIGFPTNPFVKETKQSEYCVVLGNLVIKLLEKKKKVIPKSELSIFKGFPMKDVVEQRNFLNELFLKIGIENAVILEMIFLLLHNTSLYIKSIPVLGEKKDINKIEKECEKQLKTMYDTFSALIGDKSIAQYVRVISNVYSFIFNDINNTFTADTIAPLHIITAEQAELVAVIGSVVLIFESDGKVIIRNNDGDIKSAFKLPSPIKAVSSARDVVYGITSTHLYSMNMNGIAKEIEHPSECVFTCGGKFYISDGKNLEVYDQSFVLLFSIKYPITQPIMDMYCSTNGKEYVCICGMINETSTITFMTDSLETNKSEKLPYNEKVVSITSNGENILIGTSNGWLFKYHNTTLVDCVHLRCGVIKSLQIIGKTAYVFSTTFPVIVLYLDTLTILAASNLVGFTASSTAKQLPEKRPLTTTRSSPDISMFSKHGSGRSKSTNLTNKKKDKRNEIWVVGNGKIGSFVFGNDKHKKLDIFIETNAFTNEQGASTFELSLLQSIAFVIYSILSPFCGKIGDKFNPYIIIRIAFCFFIAAVVVILISPTSFICTIGLESELGCENRNTSLYQVSWSIGKAFGFLFGGILKGALGTNALYICIGIILSDMVIYPFRHPKEIREKKKAKKRKEKENKLKNKKGNKKTSKNEPNEFVDVEIPIKKEIELENINPDIIASPAIKSPLGDTHQNTSSKSKSESSDSSDSSDSDSVVSSSLQSNVKDSTSISSSPQRSSEKQSDSSVKENSSVSPTHLQIPSDNSLSLPDNSPKETLPVADIQVDTKLLEQPPSPRETIVDIDVPRELIEDSSSEEETLRVKWNSLDLKNKTYIYLGFVIQLSTYGTSAVITNMYVKLAQEKDITVPFGNSPLETYIAVTFFFFFLAQTICMGAMSLTLLWTYRRSLFLLFQTTYMAFLITLSVSSSPYINWFMSFLGGLTGGFAYQTSTYYSLRASESSKSMFIGISECIGGLGNSLLPLFSGLLCTFFNNNYYQIYVTVIFVLGCVIVEEIIYHIAKCINDKRQSKRVDPTKENIQFDDKKTEVITSSS
ncbi:Phorbol-ester/DAG-type domain-containing protein [Entamoeba marina]